MKAAEKAIKVANNAYKLSKAINNKTNKSKRVKVIGSPNIPFRTTRTKRVKRLRVNYGGTFNVKHDRDKWVTTFKKQKVTKQQQRRINRRFKNGQATPYVVETENKFIDTTTQHTDEAKFMWFTHCGMAYLQQAFSHFKFGSNQDITANVSTVTSQTSTNTAPNQAMYFSKCVSKYEIFNPTNYDMTVVIYDIVCKEDTRNENTSFMINSHENDLYELGTNTDNPISLWDRGYKAVKGRYNLDGLGNADTIQVAKANINHDIWDIQGKPTDSYPFNIHYKIVKKRTFKLQPGANMHHKFVWRPKCLMSRGFYGYKYQDNPIYTAGVENGTPDIAIKNLTCGTLFKFYGQISGDTASTLNSSGHSEMLNEKAVTNLSGRLMVKEWTKINAYYCSPKAGVYLRYDSHWSPVDEETLNIPTYVKIEPANDDMETQDQTVED